MAAHRDLAVARLAERAGVLALDAHRGTPLLGEAGVVDDEHRVALGAKVAHLAHALAVEVHVVPGHVGEQVLQRLLTRAGQHLGERVAVLSRVLGEEPGDVALERLRARPLDEVHLEGRQELGQLQQSCLGGTGHSRRHLHLHHRDLPPVYELSRRSTKQY